MKKYTREELLNLTVERYGEDWKNVRIKSCLSNGDISDNDGLFVAVIIPNLSNIWNRNGMLFDGENWAEPLLD